MRNRNYVFRKMENLGHETYESATFGGIAIKTGILLAITIISACLSIIVLNTMPAISTFIYFAAFVSTIVFQLIISFSPLRAKYFSVPYVISEGFLLGVICGLIELVLPNEGFAIVGYALLITVGIFAASLIAFKSERIRVTNGLIKFMFVALLGILIGSVAFSILDLILLFTSGINLYSMYIGSSLSILISIIMIVISSIYAIITLNNARLVVENGLDKQYEWYASFGIVFSIIWIFEEVLKLLLRIALRNRRN